MDLALSSRIKAIFTKVFCTFFTPFSPPSIRGHLPAYRGVAAIDEVPRTDPYETAIDSDIFIKWQRGWTSLCRTCPESNHSSSARLLHPGSIFQLAAQQMEAQRHGKQTRYASFFPPSLPFPFNFDLYFKNSVQSSILYSSPFHSFYSSDLSKIPFDRYHSTTLFLPSFLIYSHFFVIRITLFQIYPDRRPNFSSIFLSLSRISLLQRFLSNHFSPFFLFPSSIYFYLCSIISIF